MKKYASISVFGLVMLVSSFLNSTNAQSTYRMQRNNKVYTVTVEGRAGNRAIYIGKCSASISREADQGVYITDCSGKSWYVTWNGRTLFLYSLKSINHKRDLDSVRYTYYK